jgi:hypothetical protein
MKMVGIYSFFAKNGENVVRPPEMGKYLIE